MGKFELRNQIMKKGSKLYSIFKRKCPHCHEGDFFEGNWLKANIKEKCDNCGEKFSKEPGFYQGSYYVVYALGVAVFVSLWVATRVLFPLAEMMTYVWVILAGLFILAPLMYPLSKIIWANFFFNYKKEKLDPKHEDA